MLHLRGNEHKKEAAQLYRQILEETQSLRSERPDLLQIVGWCAFRLGLFTTAARALLEVLSTTKETTGSDFDLALVLFCDPDSRHGVESYHKAVQSLQGRHLQGRRGVLHVALADFHQALVDHPELRDLKSADALEELLMGALAALPPPPLASIHRSESDERL